ncbi:GNAT family N-acetyltransferase [candidate division KSB1 bacterium]|jgi:GNAT superfamily N-acetyltransferase|nr:GNAT family N-acetyltransferase [candidate division KSB1 bacterium]
MKVEVKVTYLEMTSPEQLVPSSQIIPEADIREARIVTPELNWFFYHAVGQDWNWTDCSSYTLAMWQRFLEENSVQTHIFYHKDTPVGYGELAWREKDVEMTHFGLLARFIGKGMGGYFLTEMIRSAWDQGAHRVWLHTCTLDHPAAMKNYMKRGFSVFKTKTNEVEIPDESVKLWVDQ